jgi:hypothetical protein
MRYSAVYEAQFGPHVREKLRQETARLLAQGHACLETTRAVLEASQQLLATLDAQRLRAPRHRLPRQSQQAQEAAPIPHTTDTLLSRFYLAFRNANPEWPQANGTLDRADLAVFLGWLVVVSHLPLEKVLPLIHAVAEAPEGTVWHLGAREEVQNGVATDIGAIS